MRNHKIGSLFYHYYADSEDGSIKLFTYCVRTIRGGKIYATYMSKGVTYDERKGKIIWKPGLSKFWREWWREGTKPAWIHSTKLRAATVALSRVDPEDFESVEAMNKAVASLKRAQTMARKRRGDK